MYGVKFFVNGKWVSVPTRHCTVSYCLILGEPLDGSQVTVLVDDRIPCTWDGQFWQPIFAKPMKHNKQVTLMLFNLQSQSTLSKSTGRTACCDGG